MPSFLRICPSAHFVDYFMDIYFLPLNAILMSGVDFLWKYPSKQMHTQGRQ